MKKMFFLYQLISCALLYFLPIQGYKAQPALTWEGRYDSGELTNKNDFASVAYLTAEAWSKTLKVDDKGNVYVTGHTRESAGGSGNKAITTLKYNAVGVLKWTKVFDSSGVDIGIGVGVDKLYNVYVAGYTDRGSSSDFVVLKYDSSGNELWRRIHDFGYGGFDISTSMDVNAEGYVAVTGYGYGTGGMSGTKEDYVTLMYNTNGVLLFAKRYNGTGTSGFVEDYAFSVKVTGNAIVYVTGKSAGAGGANFDCLTIKYDSLGNSKWVQRYDGGNGEDRAVAMDLDSYENIYITGRTRNASGNSDLLTIKYDSSSIKKWSTAYDRGGTEGGLDIAVHSDGAVYVSGEKTGSSILDFLSIKYNSMGDTLWGRIHASGERAYANTLDKSGNLYVCGNDYLNDYRVVKYGADGTESWSLTYNGPAASTDIANDIAVDADGNLYVFGSSTGIGTAYDYCLLKYGIATGILPVMGKKSIRDAYPNPCFDRIYISVPNTQAENVSLVITDITGKIKTVTPTISATDEKNEFEVNVSNWAPGIYFYTLRNKEQVYYGNFVVTD